jgi:hypothetical protein
LSLEGATLRPDSDVNRELYGRDISNQEILQEEVKTPRAARALIVALNRYSGPPAESGESVSESLKQGGGATLAVVHFDTGKSDITSDSQSALSDLAKTLKDNPIWNIRVEGYTDSKGNADANRQLSEDPIGFYLGHSAFTSAYGAAASLVIFLIWIFYSAQILLFGAELTHVYAFKYGSRKGMDL